MKNQLLPRVNTLSPHAQLIAINVTARGRTRARCSCARSVHGDISGRACLERWRRFFWPGRFRKKFAAINDSVNLHTSAIGGDKWPGVAPRGERSESARINNRANFASPVKEADVRLSRRFRVFIRKLIPATLSLYNVAMTNACR